MGTHNPWTRRPTGPLGRRQFRVEAAYGDEAGPSPTEWQGLAGEKLPCEAERRLWLAIVEAAVVDAVGPHLADEQDCLACDGWRWLLGEAFAAVAEALGLDPDAVRSRLAREVTAHGAHGGELLDRVSRRRRFQAATRRRRGHTAVGARELH